MGKNILLSAAFIATSSIGHLIPGVYSPQVTILQRLLNLNPATMVATYGPGSPGKETEYFGPETFAALKRFQTLYASAILTPWGLSTATGFLGPLTLEKLNEIAGEISQNIPTPNQNNGYTKLQDPLAAYRVATGTIDIYSTDKKIIQIRNSVYSILNTALAAHETPQINPATYSQALNGSVILTDISKQYAAPGTLITLSAKNLDTGPTNNVYFSVDPGGVAESIGVFQGATVFAIKNISSVNGTISFTLPAFPPGRYDVAIGNSYGMSNTSFFVVAGAEQQTVSISSLSSATVHWGDTLTVYGNGFTPQNNEVFTLFGTIPGVPSPDGHSLTIRIAPEQMKEDALLGNGTISVPNNITIVNDNGYTVTPTGFSIKI